MSTTITGANTFAGRLREIQRAYERTQRQMADEIGIHVNSLKNYEGGKTTPDAEVLERVCRFYQVSPRWLLLGDGDMFAGEEEPPSGLAYAERAAFVRGIAELEPKRRTWIRAAIWMLQQIEARDRATELLALLTERGATGGRMGRVASWLKETESQERQILAAFFTAAEFDEDTGGEETDQPGPGKSRRRKFRVPRAARGNGLERYPVPEGVQEALERYEQSWARILADESR